MGIKKRKPPLAEGMAFRRKTQSITGSASRSSAECGANLLEIRSCRWFFFPAEKEAGRVLLMAIKENPF